LLFGCLELFTKRTYYIVYRVYNVLTSPVPEPVIAAMKKYYWKYYVNARQGIAQAHKVCKPEMSGSTLSHQQFH
jgi:hypothetical protein